MSGLREQSITSLPQSHANPQAVEPPNPAQDVLMFVGDVTSVVTAPVDMLNQGVASLTNGISNALPSFPAARTLVDLVFGWPHSHPHPPSFGTPLPSIGPVLLAGSLNVLINGLPAARCGDIGFGAWCGGYFPMFEVFTGSSNVFIGGARASRMLIDFTRHCSLPFVGKNLGKGLSAFDKGMMAFMGGMGALGVAAQVTESANQADAAENADSAEVAAAAAAASSAAALGAAMTAAQTAADMAAMALSVGMGKDPGLPPLLCFGNFITGSMNVLIGGLPIPGWTHALAGLGKLLKKVRFKPRRTRPRDGDLSDICTSRGCPVDVATGKLYTEAYDFIVDGPIPFQFKRFYSHVNDSYGPLGKGWTHSISMTLLVDENSKSIQFTDGEGRLSDFRYLETGESDYNYLEKLNLSRTEQSRYVVTYYDGCKYIFDNKDTEGRNVNKFVLTRIEDRHDNGIEVIYNNGLPVTVIDSVKRKFQFSYNEDSRLSKITLIANIDSDSDRMLVSYEYSDAGDLITVYDALNNPARYRYDKHLLIQETDRNGLSFHHEYTTIEDEPWAIRTWGDGGLFDISFEYDLKAKKTIATDFRGVTLYYWNDLGQVVTEVDPHQGVWKTEYDEFGNIISETDPLGGKTSQQFDSHGNLTLLTDTLGRKTEYLYNDRGLLAEIHNKNGSSEIYKYDDRENLIERHTSSGAVYKYTYDDRGVPASTIFPDGSRQRKWISSDWQRMGYRDDLGLIKEVQLDYVGDIISEYDSIGEAVRYKRDAEGRITECLYRGGGKGQLEYDGIGNILTTTAFDGRKNYYSYTSRSLISSATNASGNSARFEFDKAEFLTRVVRPDGKDYRWKIGPGQSLISTRGFDGRSKYFFYDSLQRTTEIKDSENRQTRFEYDAASNVTGIVFQDGSTTNITYNNSDLIVSADNDNNWFRRTYDNEDKLIREEAGELWVESVYDESQRRVELKTDQRSISFKYDIRGRITEILDGASVIQQFEYDELDRPVRRVCDGVTEYKVYDLMGRLAHQKIVDRFGNVVVDRAYNWDINGLLIELKDSIRGNIKYDHDVNGRVIIAKHNENNNEDIWSYDAIGNITRDRFGKHHYDDNDHLISTGLESFSYNDRGSVAAINRKDNRCDFTYNAAGRLTKVKHSDGKITEYGYDALGRRLFKNHNGIENKYLWDADNLLLEKCGSKSIQYLYYEGGMDPIGCWRDGRFYTYISNHLGVPQEMIDEAGRIVWAGKYDLWGKAQILKQDVENPHRFIGQYYDSETGLHYNRHRYYNPEIGRYLSSDPYGLEGGLNPYTYVVNPLLAMDPYGLAIHTYNQNWRGDTRSPVTVETEQVTRPSGETFERPVRVSGMVEPVSTKGRPGAPEPMTGFRPYEDGKNGRQRRFMFDRGHVMALELGGPDVTPNIVPQGSKFNQHGRWRQMEREVLRLHNTEGPAHFEVRAIYGKGAKAPHSFDVAVTTSKGVYRNPPPSDINKPNPAIKNQCK